ncbi:hypothetical protein, partial [uncultured Actinomyces sp.]|uniref:hypothetical protein n=1 Tax=uncultured Actinomyces sp. TaxID=249061 RepID=UPI002673CC2F
KSNPRDTPSQTHILTLNPKVQSVLAAAPYLVSVAKNSISDDLVPSSRAWARDKSKKNARKNEERGPLPERSDGLLFQD